MITAKTICLVAVPALICGLIALFFILGAPPWLVWPLVVASCAAAVAVIIIFRTQNWLLYALVSSASGCLAKGGLGLAIKTSGEVSDTPNSPLAVAWDLAFGGNTTVDVMLIVAGLVLFAMAIALQLIRDAIERRSMTEEEASHGGSWLKVIGGVAIGSGVVLAATTAPVTGPIVAIVGFGAYVYSTSRDD